MYILLESKNESYIFLSVLKELYFFKKLGIDIPDKIMSEYKNLLGKVTFLDLTYYTDVKGEKHNNLEDYFNAIYASGKNLTILSRPEGKIYCKGIKKERVNFKGFVNNTEYKFEYYDMDTDNITFLDTLEFLIKYDKDYGEFRY